VIVVSVLTYALGKLLGIQGAARELANQLSGRGDTPMLACIQTIQDLRRHDEIWLYHGASTTLPKARSRAAHAALAAPDADLWAMIDDDVETDPETVARLVSIARAGKVAILPCAVRSASNDHRINVLWGSALVDPTGNVATRPVHRGGCGLMIVPRPALERVRDEYRDSLSYLDDDGEQRVALFAQMMLPSSDGSPPLWLGEDYSFCERLRAVGVELAAPIEGQSMHDGAVLDLADAAALAY
jgi:hypothetical protein